MGDSKSILSEKYQYVCEKLSREPIQNEPYPHIVIEGLLPDKDYQQLLSSIPPSIEFDKVTYPGIGVDRSTKKNVNHGLALTDMDDYAVLKELKSFMQSDDFSRLLLEKFSAPGSWNGRESAIPEQKHQYFANGNDDFTTVLDLHKDLPGYEIYPHRDVDSKIITFLYYLEPDEALSKWGTMLCKPKEDLSLEDVENAQPPEGPPNWRNWSDFEVAKTAPANPNTLLVFAPNMASYHAIRMDIPEGYVRRERTAIRGFIRMGSNTSNWIAPSKPKNPVRRLVEASNRLLRWTTKSLKARINNLSIFRRPYDTIIVSYGGAGTTMLMDFLQPHLHVNNRISFLDGIKHIDSPCHPILKNHEVKRAIYLVSDPREAALSLFRRGYAQPMMAKLKAQHSSVKEYKKITAEDQPDIQSLEKFLSQDIDLFGFENHWKKWTEDNLSFPVLFVRYEALHDSVPEILEFLGLPSKLISSFPERKHRASKLEKLSSEQSIKMDKIYSKLVQEIANKPGFFIRQVSDK